MVLIRSPTKSSEAANDCDAHSRLALGLIDEEIKEDESPFFEWISLLPRNFANVLWFNEDQITLTQQTFFKYIVDTWVDEIKCMQKAFKVIWPELVVGKKAELEIHMRVKWAYSIVKTRGFAFDVSRNSTMLIPL